MDPDDNGKNNIETNFLKIKNLVLDRKPVLKEILEQHGNKTLFEYAQDYFDVNTNEVLENRRQEFFNIFYKNVKKVFGEDIAQSSTKQIKKYCFASTADHHGPLCHPFWVNSNLVTAVLMAEKKDPILNNVIVLSCSNVSLNNSSFPRGLLFSSCHDGQIKTHRLSFLPSNAHSSLVYNFRAYNQADLKKIKEVLRLKLLNNEISEQHFNRVSIILEEIYARDEALNCATFSEQVSRTNYWLWPKFFGCNDSNLPGLLYIESESLVNDLLLECHLFTDTVINRIMFNDKYEQAFIKYFDGLTGAFDLTNKIGTYFFWGINEKSNQRFSLWKDGDWLVNENGDKIISYNPNSIADAL